MATRHLEPDAFARDPDFSYRVKTLYLDNRNLDIYNGLLGDGAEYRIRTYEGCETAFLERKWCDGLVRRKKRRPWELQRLESVLSGGTKLSGWAGKFKRRIRKHRLVPTVLLAYTRRAWSWGRGGRMTIDTDITAWKGLGIRRFEPAEAPVCLDGFGILELKYDGQCPILFRDLIQSLEPTAESLSKYSRGIEAVGLAVTAPPEPSGRRAPEFGELKWSTGRAAFTP